MTRIRKLVGGAAILAALSVPARAATVYYPGNGVSLPVVVKEVHPKAAKPATIALNCVVRPNGTVGSVNIASSPLHPTLNRAAVRALREWRFKPGLKRAKPLAVRISVELSFVQGRHSRGLATRQRQPDTASVTHRQRTRRRHFRVRVRYFDAKDVPVNTGLALKCESCLASL